MTLRSKILLVTGLLCATLIGVATIIIAGLSLSSYARLEQQSLERNLERVSNSLEASTEQLVIANRSYAYWDDTHAFMLGNYPEYPADNSLDSNIFMEVDIDLMVFADLSGQSVYNGSFHNDHATLLDEATLSVLRPLLVRDVTDVTEKSGFISLPNGLAAVSSLPIRNNLATVEPVGSLVMVRYTGAKRLDKLREADLISLTFTTLAASSLKGELSTPQLLQVAGQVMRGFQQVPSINGGTPLLLMVEMPRTIYQQGFRNVILLVIVLVLVGIACVIAVTYFLERTILKRLSTLSQSVRSISETGDITARTTLSGKDELAFLSNEINRMLTSLEHQEEALRKSNQELEQFAYVASHDLQEPLRKVQAFSDRLATKYADKLDDDGKLYISRMQDATVRMRTLIQDLLTFSRIRSKGQEFVSVDLNEIVRGVVSDLEVRLEQSGGRVEVDTLPIVLADPLQMRQVFQNLIGNALKFKKSGVPPIVRVMSRPKGELHRIIVQDNGIGFEQQYAEKVFEIFQRLHGRSDFEGTGMGSIRAESEPGKGARFILTLPNHESDLKQAQSLNQLHQPVGNLEERHVSGSEPDTRLKKELA
jgi:signal transduction histidine kinase